MRGLCTDWVAGLRRWVGRPGAGLAESAGFVGEKERKRERKKERRKRKRKKRKERENERKTGEGERRERKKKKKVLEIFRVKISII